MKVRYIMERVSGANQRFDLGFNKTYLVYGVVWRENSSWFYILEEEDEYPILYPSAVFDIDDERLSKYWVKKKVDRSKSLLFREWSENDEFYSDLVDCETTASQIFTKYRFLMENEFRNERIHDLLLKNGATVLDFKYGTEFLFELKEIYGEDLHNRLLSDLDDAVWKWTKEPIRHSSQYPVTEPVVLFFEKEVDSRFYLLPDISQLSKVFDDHTVSFYITNTEKDFLVSVNSDSVIVGSGIALEWEFWN